LTFPFFFLCVCVMCTCGWCKLCNHSNVHPSTSSPDRLQTSWGGWPEHQSRIPCDFLLLPYPVLQVLFHPEYLLAKKAAVCHVDKTWEWKILARPLGMIQGVPKHIFWVPSYHILLDYWGSCLQGRPGMWPFYWFPHYLFCMGANLGSITSGNNMCLRIEYCGKKDMCSGTWWVVVTGVSH